MNFHFNDDKVFRSNEMLNCHLFHISQKKDLTHLAVDLNAIQVKHEKDSQEICHVGTFSRAS